MKVQSVEVTIVGGGLAGLYAANQLEKRNVSYQLFDAKPLFGGRIAGIPWSMSNTQFFDVGPTWVFPHHKATQALVKQFGLSLFPQFAKGDVLYQFENIKESRRISSPPSLPLYRIKGGVYSLIRAMVGNVNSQSLHAGHQVKAMAKVSGQWQLNVGHKDGSKKVLSKRVILAMPPRIIARDFAQSSWMNKPLLAKLTHSQTWMSAQAKMIITYPKPFWREQGLSGQAFSQVGPLVEIYDASCSDTEGFALFGFVGIPATQRIHESQKELKQACIKQLAAIFGQDAYRFEKCYLKDWAKDKGVCTGQDQSEGSRHPQVNIDELKQALIDDGVFFAGSEFAANEAGYLEGAINAVDDAILALENN